MNAVYKKELKSAFTNMTGAIAIAVMLLVVGLMFRYYNLYNGVLTMHYTISNSTLMFYIAVPVLTMRIFAEERKLKTDQLLLTSPVSISKIVFGKYLSMVTVLLIPTAVSCILPLIMLKFGQETIRWDYACIFLFFLMGCAYLAVGMFISACTESVVIAAILSILFVFATQMLSSIFTIIGSSPLSSLLFLIVLAGLAGLLTFYLTNHLIFSAGVFAALGILSMVSYAVKPEWFSGRSQSILRIFDFSTHFADVAAGSFSIANAVFFLSYIAAGIILTIQAMNKRRGSIGLANGTYTLVSAAFFIAAVVLVNLIVMAIPSTLTTVDLTDQKLYSIGETTKGVLDALDEDVTLYFVSESGQEDEGVSKLIDSYDGYSKHINVEKIDAVENPLFARQYGDGAVALNSVIAVAGEKSKVASYNDFYNYSYSASGYQASGWDAEGKITSAIAYVTSKDTTTVYYTVGHDELELGPELTDAIDKANIDLKELNLLSSSIPKDCDTLILFAPGEDLTEEEAKKVREYLADGGHALIVSMAELVNGKELPNFDSIMAAYGVTKETGIVMEADEVHFVQAPYLLVPNIGSSSEVTSGLANKNIVYSLAEALQITENDDQAYTVTDLLTSSDQAYLKNDISGTVTKEDGDESGQFVLAVSVEHSLSDTTYGKSDIEEFAEEEAEEEKPSQAKMTKILYFTSPCALNSAALSSLIQQSTALPEGNTTLVSASVNYLTNKKVSISVPSKMLATPQTIISQSAVSVLGGLFMYLLPAAVVVLSFAVFLRRRKR